MVIKTGIYGIKNKINNKIYIGQSVNIYQRWKSHKSRCFLETDKSYNLPLYRAIRKYGIDNFDFFILKICSKEELNYYEQFYIDKFDSLNKEKGYNLVDNDNRKNGFQKISKEQKEEIYFLLKETEQTFTEIAKLFNISVSSVSQINSGLQLREENETYPLRKKEIKNKEIHKCLDCGKTINKKSLRCSSCAATFLNKEKWKERPSRDELKELIRHLNFEEIGRLYNISGNGIRRWCEHYNLPKTKREINSYSEEEWNLI